MAERKAKQNKAESETPEITVDELIDKLSELQERANEEKARADAMKDALQRLQAEFDNYRRRTNETNKRVRDDGRLEVIERLLPIGDVVEQALTMIQDENIASGIRMIGQQIDTVLNSCSVTRMQTDGEPFDPTLHEAVLQTDAGTSGVIQKTLQAGYVMGERVIRAARVIVAK